MKGLLPSIRKSLRLALSTAGVALITFGMIGCDSSGDDEDPDPVPTECGGFGVLCDVSGIAGQIGFSGEGGPATEATHYWPMDVTPGANGVLYVVDWNNHMVRKIDENGIINKMIGAGNLGDDSSGPSTQLSLNHPVSLTIGPDTDFYLASWHNWKIKQVDSATLETSAPIGTTQGFLGDGGPATMAKMDIPSSVVFAPNGNIYISDQANQRIRVVTPDGMINTFAGNGTQGFADGIGTDAIFNNPKGPSATPGGKLVLNPDGTALYVADTNNNRIRRIDLATAEVTTIAGTGTAGYAGDGGPASAAQLHGPTDVAFSHDNDLFIADSQNHVIRMIAPDGTISTVAGTGVLGVSPNATKATEAMLNQPYGVGYDDATHTLYIADTFNQMTKKVYLGHDE